MHLFLSPHFDDAALSCGGQIAQLTQRGEKVVVFTVMAGDPPVEFNHTPYTQELHKRWGLGNSPIEGRRLEDKIALRSLGADVKFGPYPDAVYRVDAQGQPLYPESTSIFGEVHPDDPVRGAKRAAVIQTLLTLFAVTDQDSIHVPLAVGKHVDHILVRDMGKALSQWRPNNPIYFYEDYPYARQHGHNAVLESLVDLDIRATPVMHLVDATAVEIKIAAISCYKSQMSSFWDSREAMGNEIRAYIKQTGGEREWHLITEA